jgi:two-component system NtrC family response regulator
VIGQAPRFVETLELLMRVASTDASILISGDTGTGKEGARGRGAPQQPATAQAVHQGEPRRRPVGLFDSELFGHVRGAFTDASADRPGRIAAAQSGTILLDEIGDLDLACQVKLLRVLQDRSYEVLGTNRPNRSTCASSRRPTSTWSRHPRRDIPRGPLLPHQPDPGARAVARRARE